MQTLKNARENKGVSKSAIAKYLGVTRQTYAGYEKNQGSMSIDKAKDACAFLGVNVDDIFFADRC